jgi:hypothetical protein
MVTGTTLNGTRTRAGWASYFLDHSSVLPGRPSTKLVGPPAHCSYLREALLEVGGFPEHLRAGEDTVVNNELAGRGYEAYRAQEVRLVHHSPCRTVSKLLRHHFTRGRGYGRILLGGRRNDGMLLRTSGLRSLYRLQVRARQDYTSRRVRAWGGDELQLEFARARRLVRAATLAYWLGTCYELFRPGRGKAFVLWGKPVVTVAEGAGTVARVDVLTRRKKVVHLPDGVDPAEHGVAVDGSGLRARFTLAWARLAVRPDDVHEIELRDGDEELTDALRRCLDTRGLRERTAPLPVG